MENIPGDLLRNIGKHLSVYDLYLFCLSNSKIKNAIYENKFFWTNKLIRDYPLYFQKKVKINNPRYKYLKKMKCEKLCVYERVHNIYNNKKSLKVYHSIYLDYFNYFYDKLNITSESEVSRTFFIYFLHNQREYIKKLANHYMVNSDILYIVIDGLNIMRSVNAKSYKIIG